MPKKGRGHSKKTRHPGVGVSAQGKSAGTKTDWARRKKVKPKKNLCPFCDDETHGIMLVEPTGKVKRNGLHCKSCNIAIFGKRRVLRFPDWVKT